MNNEYDQIDDSKIDSLKGAGGFTVPEDYFGQARNAIFARTLASEENPAQVSADYFEKSRASILAQTISSRPQKMQIWYRKSLFRYAAAAVLIFSSLSVFWIQSHSSATALANVSDEEILYYLQTNDLKDIPMSEVSFASSVSNSSTPEETYIITHTDEQTLLEEL